MYKHSFITPVGKPRMTQRDKWAQRPSVTRYRTYCDQLRYWLGEDYELPPALQVAFFLPMPRSWSMKKRERMAYSPHLQRPDIDNLVKGFMDAFKKEDSHVYKLKAEKVWAREGKIEVWQAGEKT